jgi:Inner membrane protein YgaP-like, transmembrane domain
MVRFFRFIGGPFGRLIRIVLGLVLIAVGTFWIGGWAGFVVAVIGVVPLAAGIFDWCVFAPLFALPFVGKRLRQEVERSEGEGYCHE